MNLQIGECEWFAWAKAWFAVMNEPISLAVPSKHDRNLSVQLEATLKKFDMFETDEGMQTRLVFFTW